MWGPRGPGGSINRTLAVRFVSVQEAVQAGSHLEPLGAVCGSGPVRCKTGSVNLHWVRFPGTLKVEVLASDVVCCMICFLRKQALYVGAVSFFLNHHLPGYCLRPSWDALDPLRHSKILKASSADSAF